MLPVMSATNENGIRVMSTRPRPTATPIAEEPSVYPCTYPGCLRGPDHPFDSAASLGNHRWAAHAIRSTNHESIARQGRRDRVLEERRRAAAPVRPPSPATRQLDLGEREMIRRQLYSQIGMQARSLRRSEDVVIDAVIELAATRFADPKPQRRVLTADDAYAVRG